MVANLSAHKAGWDERWSEFSEWAEKGKKIGNELTRMVDADTDAFNEIMAAFRLPATNAEEEASKEVAIQAATKLAIEVPLRVMELSLASMEIARNMAEKGLPASASDAGVAALCARAAVMGGFLNVRINTGDLKDATQVADYLKRGEEMQAAAQRIEGEVLAIALDQMSDGDS